MTKIREIWDIGGIKGGVIGVIAVGVTLRVAFLEQHQLWFDEAFSYFVAKQDIGKLVSASLADNHPPLYFLVLHYFMMVTGQGEIGLRLLSLAIGVSIICVLYWGIRLLGKEVSGLREVGVVWGMLISLSPLLVYYSAEVRMYGLLVLLSFMSVILWVKFLKEGRLGWLGGFGVVFIASLWTHYYSALLYPALALSLGLYPARIKLGLIGLLVSVLGIVPLVNSYLSQPHPGYIAASDWLGLPATLASFAIGGTGVVTLREYFGNDTVWWVKLLFGGVAMGMSLIFLRGVREIWRVREVEGRLWLVMFFTPLLVVVVGNLFWPILSVRALIILAPYYYLIAAFGLTSLQSKRLISGLMIFGLIGVNFIVLSNPLFKGPKIKEVINLVDTNLPTLHTSILTYYPFRYYQNDHLNLLVTTSPLSPKTVEIIGGKTVKEIPIRFSLVQIQNGADTAEEGLVINKLQSSYKLSWQEDLFPIKVSYYLKSAQSN